MCGRFSLTVDAQTLINRFQLKQSLVMIPRYNIAPTQVIPVIRTPGSLEFLYWGFKPLWMKLPASNPGFFNARAETARTKPAFRNAFAKRRCLVIVDGYYEWKPMEKIKQPFYIHQKDHEVFAMAGLWEEDTCTILTIKANEQLTSIHDRMPVIIHENDYSLWLNPKTNLQWVEQQLTPRDYINMMFYPVSTRVNHVKMEGSECVQSL